MEDKSLDSYQDSLSDTLLETATSIDQLITTDIPLRGVIQKLYPYARTKMGMPLTLAAAQALVKAVAPTDVVFIATGWLDRPHISLEIAETDGPPGAVILGRALQRAFNAIPFFFVEDEILTAMVTVVQAGGFKVLSPQAAIKAAESTAPIHAATVLGFPSNLEDATEVATRFIKEYRPSVVVSIEKGGMNSNNTIHTSRGDDATEHMAKIDLLMREAKRHRILTIGVGDGGNEIGMGVIQRGIREALPFGDIIAPVTKTDCLVTATVSNWGAYGIAACLAVLLGQREVFHDEQLEERILHRCADAGLIDGISGYVEEGADGLPSQVHVALVTILAELVKQGISSLKKE